MVDALFQLYFGAGKDISDHAVLVSAAESAGMDGELVARLLGSEADLEEIRQEDATAREMGISGVPTFIIDGRYVLTGAQDSDVWRRVLEELSVETT